MQKKINNMRNLSKNYILIQGWMVQDLNLSSNNLLVYSLIYGFCQDNQSEFTGSISYICDWLNCTRPTASKALDFLCSNNYIFKTTEVKNKVIFNRYKINFEILESIFTGSKEILQGVVKNLYGGSKKSLHNNTNIDIDYNKLIEFFNSVTGKKARTITEDAKKRFKKILQSGYTKEDIAKAIKNCFEDEYHQKHRKYLTLDFISRMDKFQMYVDCEKPEVKLPSDWQKRYLSEDQKKLLSKEDLSKWNTNKNRIEMENGKMLPILN